MNLPVTNPVVSNVSLEKVDVNKLFLDLRDKNFEGYCYLVTLGKYGFEESVLVISKGQILGDMFLVEGYDLELYGREAITLCLNSYGSKCGILNIFGLSQDQTKLILLFNEKIKHIVNIVNKQSTIFKDIKYNEKLLDDLLLEKTKKEKTSKEIFNNFDLNDLLRE